MIFPTTPVEYVQFAVMIGFLVMGLSHIVQPKMWIDYFDDLKQQGHKGVVTSIAGLQLFPALLIVAVHQVWSGPALILTLYGWLLLAKCIVALLVPDFGLRGLGMAKKHNRLGYIVAGLMLLGIAAFSGAALYL